MPPRLGRLFDPSAFPFLEGRLPGQASPTDPKARAATQPPSVDDGSVFQVLRRLLVFKGQRLSYRALDVEQIGSVYESLMGFEVRRLHSPALRLGKQGVWIEVDELLQRSAAERNRYLKEVCNLTPAQIRRITAALGAAPEDPGALAGHLAAALGGRVGQAPAGTLVLQPGEERRRSGSHYTPRSLTETIVRRTLEPLLKTLGPEPSAEQLLQLKICDPAMGSGAFLVAVCRELASELVAAWTRSGELPRIIEAHGDAHLHGRRLVAQRCLYGVDRNPMAAELAKLSLWLITLSRQLPFTFVDHALRHGDSLVGLDFEQIKSFHWQPSKQVETCYGILEEALQEAVGLRQEILALAEREDPAAQEEKRRLFYASLDATEKVRFLADLCVGAFFAEDRARAREKERLRRLDRVETWIGKGKEAQEEHRSTKDREAAALASRLAYAELEPLVAETRESLSPFHWWIEFPEVFFEARPDPLQGGEVSGEALMEGVVGNPPFLGGSSISGTLGPGMRDWLLALHPGSHGNGDLSAHFFRRASRLLGANGSMGLIATNTIAQGDTRSTGLKVLLQEGWKIYDATDSMRWPGAAAVTVSVVHLLRGCEAAELQMSLGDKPAEVINSRLRPKPERADPLPLKANASHSFLGSKIYGQGFVLTPEEREELIRKDPRNAERIFPYLGGEEVNTSPSQDFHRYVISFGEMSLEEAERWPDLLRIVREKVKPERDRLRDNADGRRRKAYWWQFGRSTPALDAALASLDRCLVNSQVSKHLVYAFQPAKRIFAHTLYAYLFAGYSSFTTLQSRIHEPWARLLSSSLGGTLRYASSDCLETFPFPKADPRSPIPSLEAIGKTLYEARAAFMLEHQQGLTQLYNQLKDPQNEDAAILKLRKLHEALDEAVLAAYGWEDLKVPPYCPASLKEKEALQAFEDEVIDRLYLLNAERSREEKLLGATAKKKNTKSQGAVAKRVSKKKQVPQGGLFE